MLKPLLYLSVALMLSSCTHTSSVVSGSGVDAIRDSDAALSRAVEDKNLDAIMAFYADDAVLLPTAEPIIVGKSAIREEWRHILAIPDLQNKPVLTKIDVSIGGDMAYSMGTYMATMLGEDGKPVAEPGKWLSVWKRQTDGKWLVVVDTYNTDIPPPDHK